MAADSPPDSIRCHDVHGLAGWFQDGTTLGVAADMDQGRLLVAASSEHRRPQWLTAAEELPLSSADGRTLFPAASGQQGACVRFNFGYDPVRRPFKIAPPSAGFETVAAVAAAAVGHQVCRGFCVAVLCPVRHFTASSEVPRHATRDRRRLLCSPVAATRFFLSHFDVLNLHAQ